MGNENTFFWEEGLGQERLHWKKQPGNQNGKNGEWCSRLFPLCLVFQPVAKYVGLAQDHGFVGVCNSQELPHSAAGGKYWPPSLWCGGPVCIIGSHPHLSSRQLGRTNPEREFRRTLWSLVPLRNEPPRSEKCPGWPSTVEVWAGARGEAE